MADVLDLLLQGIAGVESGGRSNPYSAEGPTVRGDHAYGKYQVMGSNVPAWTKEVLGRALTPLEFLNSPGAQEKIARAKIGQYLTQYGNPQDAASKWFSGRPVKQAGNASDGNLTTPQYVVRATKDIPGTTLNTVPGPDIGSGVGGGIGGTVPAAAGTAVAAAPPDSIWQSIQKGDWGAAAKTASAPDKDGKSPIDKALGGIGGNSQQSQSAPMTSGSAMLPPTADQSGARAQAAQQLFAQILAQQSKPLSWSANPYASYGPQGTTLNSMVNPYG